MNRFEYVSPKSVEDALQHLPAGRPKAGGTDLVCLMKDRIIAPPKLVNLQGLDLRSIQGGAVGALVTLSELAANEEMRAGYTALAQAAGEAATPQVRNMATVGGNLCQRIRCWYFRNDQFTCLKKGGQGCRAIDGDNRYHSIFGAETCVAVHPSNLAPALVALEGNVKIVGPKGARSVTAEKFFEVDDPAKENILADDEIIVGIDAAPGWRSVYLEVREKQSFDWPLAAVAAAVKNGQTRIVLGAVAPKPWLVRTTDPREIVKDAKPLQHNAYKVKLVQTLVERALAALR